MKQPTTKPHDHLAIDVVLGAVTGFAGGLIGSAGMNLLTLGLTNTAGLKHLRRAALQGGQVSKKRGRETRPATYRAAQGLSRQLLGKRASAHNAERTGVVLHFLFGGLAGATYGALRAIAPEARRGFGLPFGAAVWLAADEIGVPLSGLSEPPHKHRVSHHLYSLVNHLIFGVITELVCAAGSHFVQSPADNATRAIARVPSEPVETA